MRILAFILLAALAGGIAFTTMMTEVDTLEGETTETVETGMGETEAPAEDATDSADAPAADSAD